MHHFFFFFILLFYAEALVGQGIHSGNMSADVVSYDFNLALNDTTNIIEGAADIAVKLSGPQDSLYLDLICQGKDGKGMVVKNVTISGHPSGWKHMNDQLSISTCDKDADTLYFTVFYSGVPADGLIISRNRFGKRVFFSDHWPDRARNYLPCVDHPSDKAAVAFTITAPTHYRIVANGILSSEGETMPGYKTTRWKEDIPLPVKVMAFGAADFAVLDTAMVGDIPVSSWVFAENSMQGFYDYSVAVRPLHYYTNLIGEYPYKKLANVQSITIYGGLENAGTIFYAQESVTGRGQAERLIAHEIAHQWFGNSVTEKEWHHLWLSEGFATYLTSMYFEAARGVDYFKADLDSSRERIIRYYRINKNPVIDTTVTDLMDLLNTNSYQKGAWFLHMLRHKIGDEAFKKGLRIFYEKFRGSNVLTYDFMDVMEETSGMDLNGFFRQWLRTGGHPELKIRIADIKRRKSELIIGQKQEHLFEFPLRIVIMTSAGEHDITIQISERETRVPVKGRILSFKTDPDVKLLFDYQGSR